MNPEIRILMLEDEPSDAELARFELRRAGIAFVSERVDTREGFVLALETFKPDIVLSDFQLPSFDGLSAVRIVRESYPDIPVIMVSGALGDESAVDLLKAGAKDYVLKDRLVRLAPAVLRVLSAEQGIRGRKLAEEKYRALFTEAKDGIVLLDCDTGNILECNPEYARMCGRTPEELKRHGVWESHPAEMRETGRQKFLEVIRHGAGGSSELPLQRPDGELTYTEFTASTIRVGYQCYVQAIIRDVTERRRAEQALLDSEARYRRITESLTDYQYTVRLENGRVVETSQSPACVTVTGYRADEFATNPHLWLQMVVPEDRELVLERVRQVLAGKDVPPIEHRIIRKDGKQRWVSDTIILFRDATGKLLSYDGVIRDITERIQWEKSIRDSEEKYHAIFEHAKDSIFLLDKEGRYLSLNSIAEQITGYTRAELLGQSFMAQAHPDDLPGALDVFRKVLAGASFDRYEMRVKAKSGIYLNAEMSLVSVKYGDASQVLGVARDITERKRAEIELRRINRALRTISSCNETLIHATDESQLLNDMCRIIVEHAGYSLAWVGYAEHDEHKTVRPVAYGGYEQGYLERAQVTWANNDLGRGPTGTAIRTQKAVVVGDTLTDPAYLPWRENSVKLGYRSILSLPLASLGQLLGALTIYSPENNGFSMEEIRLLEELADDLAFGIITLRTRILQEQSAQRLLRSVEGTIAAMAAIVELRDPYTAGHQRRVAGLAQAIAREMQWSDEDAHGIYVAAVIHDLGKIRVPAEILSKPAQLSSLEFQLIQTHPQAGYDILKEIDFPWPIAQMVYQHHERLDGSGYPRGLKDTELMPGANILAVADTVEAMASHRPYRPALGIEAALQEITQKRGIRYDAQAVDACVSLFHERGYSLPP